MLFMPTVVLFYQENGMNMHDIMLLQAIFSITVAIIEIPSGYVADVLGRKNAMIIGTLLGLIGIIIYSFTYGFLGFLPAALCLGMGQSFLSGSDTALMYDSLLSINKEKEFVKYEGRTISMGNFAEAIGFVIGGFLAEISLRTPFYYQIGITFTGCLMALLLVEPNQQKWEKTGNAPWRNIQQIVRYALLENSKLRHYIFYSAIIGMGTLSMAWLVQAYFETLQIELQYFGIIGAILNLAVALSAFYAHKIEKMLPQKKLLALILFAITGIYWVTGYYVTLASLIGLLLFYLVRGVATPILRDYINGLSPSEMRATIMSIRGFIIRALFACIAPFLGYMADVYTIGAAFLMAGIITCVLGATVLIFLFRRI